MSLMNYLNDLVKQSFSNNGYTIENKAVKLSDRPDLSQFQCNEAFEIAKATRQNPRVVAEKIAAELRQNPVFKDVSVAGPGFINISLSDTFLANYIQEMSIDPKMGIRADKPKKILIDYGGANVAKPLHVGHLRSAIIGEGLKRLAKELGHDVIGDVHLGDWGRPLGIVISEIKRRNPGLVYFDENYTGEYPSESPVTMDDLNEIYPTASAAAKEDEENFNEFTKKFNETEVLKEMYKAGYTDDVYTIILDEMNIARVEYYFAEMLSILEMPNKNEWVIEIVPSSWKTDPKMLKEGKLKIPPNMWYIGTINNDDSTFMVTDKVYDRAMPIDINDKGKVFTPIEMDAMDINYSYLDQLFSTAMQEHQVSEETLAKIEQMDDYTIKHFRIAFGNRIVAHMKKFVPVFVACGGDEIEGVDYFMAKKVLRKFEQLNISYIRDEITPYIDFLDKTFGKGKMKECIDYMMRLKKLT